VELIVASPSYEVETHFLNQSSYWVTAILSEYILEQLSVWNQFLYFCVDSYKSSTNTDSNSEGDNRWESHLRPWLFLCNWAWRQGNKFASSIFVFMFMFFCLKKRKKLFIGLFGAQGW
jgi:hypothetical protein